MVKKHNAPCSSMSSKLTSSLMYLHSILTLCPRRQNWRLPQRMRRSTLSWENGMSTAHVLPRTSQEPPAHGRSPRRNWFLMVLNTMQGKLCMHCYFQNPSLNSLYISKHKKLFKAQSKYHLLHTVSREPSQHALFKSGRPQHLLCQSEAIRKTLSLVGYPVINSPLEKLGVLPAMDKPCSHQMREGVPREQLRGHLSSP